MELLKVELQMMATLWENTYRAVMKDQSDNYLATARIIVNVPLSKEELPEGAPEVGPQLLVLVEDGVMESKDILDFENLTVIQLREKFKHQIEHIFFYYPSPEDVLSKQQTVAATPIQ